MIGPGTIADWNLYGTAPDRGFKRARSNRARSKHSYNQTEEQKPLCRLAYPPNPLLTTGRTAPIILGSVAVLPAVMLPKGLLSAKFYP